jgi:hypothetical protein
MAREPYTREPYICEHCGKVFDRMLIDFPEYCSIACSAQSRLLAVLANDRQQSGSGSATVC